MINFVQEVNKLYDEAKQVISDDPRAAAEKAKQACNLLIRAKPILRTEGGWMLSK